LTSALERAGIHPQGWTNLRSMGISHDGTLVWGTGTRSGAQKAYVADLPAGYLAQFAEPAVFSTPASEIVGGWYLTNSATVLLLFANGYYLHIQETTAAEETLNGTDGFERGQYSWNKATGEFKVTTLSDNNGSVGLSSSQFDPVTAVTVLGDVLRFSETNSADTYALRVPVSGYTGAWVQEDSDFAAGKFTVVVLLPNGTYLMAEEGPSDSGGQTGIEIGAYTYNAVSNTITATPRIDQNGDWGLNGGTYPLNLSDDTIDDLHRLKPEEAIVTSPAIRSQDGAFTFSVSAPIGRTVIVESSTNLSTWTPVSTNLVLDGRVSLTEAQPASEPRKYYRAIFAP
jgi:hypothetical protein